jgi:hypothetical protein
MAKMRSTPEDMIKLTEIPVSMSDEVPKLWRDDIKWTKRTTKMLPAKEKITMKMFGREKTMAREAPSEAPPDTPMMKGSARGFFSMD